MKISIKFFALLALASIGITSVANAGALSVLQNGANKLEDNAFESILDKNGTPTILDAGDILYGVFEVQAVVNSAGTTALTKNTASFTGIFATQVNFVYSEYSIGTGKSTSIYTFGAVSDSDWNNLFGAGNARNNSSTLAIVFDDPASAPKDHVDNGTVLVPEPIATAIASVVDGTKIWEVGYSLAAIPGNTSSPPASLLGLNTAGEYWQAQTEAIGTGNSTNITLITKLEFSAALNTLYYYPGAPTLNKHTNSPYAVGGPTDWQLHGTLDTPSYNWQAAADTDFWLNANISVPEPSSGLIMLVTAGLFGAVVYRRNQTKVTA